MLCVLTLAALDWVCELVKRKMVARFDKIESEVSGRDKL